MSDLPLTRDAELLESLREKDFDELTDAEITAKIRLSVRRRFDYPAWVLMFEYGAPGNSGRVCDCIAVSTSPSTNYKVIAFEFKASRSDWLREKRNPQKADYFVELADEFYVVAPKGVVEESEIPTGWGYLELKPNSEQLYKIHDSDLTPDQQGEPGRRFWARFVKQGVGENSNYTKEDLKEAESRGFEKGKERGLKIDRERELESLRTKAENWDTLRDRADFLPWSELTDERLKTFELAYRLIRKVRSDGVTSMRDQIESVRHTLDRKYDGIGSDLDYLEEGLDVLEQRISDAEKDPEGDGR